MNKDQLIELIANIRMGRTNEPLRRIPAIGVVLQRKYGIPQEVVVDTLRTALELEVWELPKTSQEALKEARLPTSWLDKEGVIDGFLSLNGKEYAQLYRFVESQMVQRNACAVCTAK